MIDLMNDDELGKLLSLPMKELMSIAFSDVDLYTEKKVATIFDMFHSLFHQYGWDGYKHKRGCKDFNRMIAIAYILGKSSRATAASGIGPFGQRLFNKKSLRYILSSQAEPPEKVFDALPGDERDGYIEICRHAFEQRISLAEKDMVPLTPNILFSAAIDSLIMMRQMQLHIMSSEGLENFVIFEEET